MCSHTEKILFRDFNQKKQIPFIYSTLTDKILLKSKNEKEQN